MKICVLLLVVSCTIHLSVSEYPRYKIRGPPAPPRPPPVPQYVKKWQHQQQQHMPRGPPPIRSRPIPVHMPASHKIPMGMTQSKPRPVAPPVRNFWKNTQTTFKTPHEKPTYIPAPENHFVSSPTMNVRQEYDFHVQSNTIPTHANPIKQVGEKGPIHTIPAPNLSLADKPIVVEEVRQEAHQPQANYYNLPNTHQYQVTEQPEPTPNQKFYRNQQPQQQQQIYYTPNYESTAIQNQPNNMQVVLQNSQNPLSSTNQINPKELYQLLNTYQNQQDVLVVPQPQQYAQQEQIATNYQALLAQQQQLFQPDHNYVQQIQQGASDKIGAHPEYQTFNYEEPYKPQNPKSLTKKELSSLVTAAYNLEPVAEASEQTRSRNSLDALAQAQYVQNYFANREDNSAGSNIVEPDAKPSIENTMLNDDKRIENDDETPEIYSSLPNKEAADALASLQAAGKVNSNLMQMSTTSTGNEKVPMTIYVPDEAENSARINEDKSKDYRKYGNEGEASEDEYEDYSQEDMIYQENRSSSEENFGQRVKPKRS